MRNYFGETPVQKVPRSVFDLSGSNLYNCYGGELIPVFCREVVPGDYVKLGNQSVIRMQPMVAPVLHEIDFTVHYFFVPNRIMWDDWEQFYTGGKDGKDATPPPTVDPSVAPSTNPNQWVASGTLWDYFGFPVNSRFGMGNAKHKVSAFPFAAYQAVYRDFYMDETLAYFAGRDDAEWKIHSSKSTVGTKSTNAHLFIGSQGSKYSVLYYRAWEKDYFTGALPFLQRGLDASLFLNVKATFSYKSSINGGVLKPIAEHESSPSPGQAGVRTLNDGTVTSQGGYYKLDEVLNSLSDDHLKGFTISEFREAIAIQHYLELRARTGYRYTETIRASFGVSPRDERLQRAEYIGGVKSPIIVSEVLQNAPATDKIDTPQGNLAGHGISVCHSSAGNYSVKEHGVIIGIASITVKPMYSQGVDRQWIKTSRYDFYDPMFAHLSEQPVYLSEIYAAEDESVNTEVWGYQERWSEMRTGKDIFTAEMRDKLKYWHMGRIFETKPVLNADFIDCVPTQRSFASNISPGYIVHCKTFCQAVRPLPYHSVPGVDTV